MRVESQMSDGKISREILNSNWVRYSRGKEIDCFLSLWNNHELMSYALTNTRSIDDFSWLVVFFFHATRRTMSNNAEIILLGWR
jgi:hypothetical protein